MKKLLSILFILLILVACSSTNSEVTTNTREDNTSGETACGLESDCDDEDEEYYALKDKNISMARVLEIFENKEDAVLYFYFNACPWCKELGPILSDYLALNDDLNAITYSINVRPDDVKDTDLRYKNDDGEYNDPDFGIFKETYVLDYLNEYDGSDTFYTPTLIFIKDGEIVYFHVGTIKGHDASEEDLTQEQVEELKKEIEEYYSIYKD